MGAFHDDSPEVIEAVALTVPTSLVWAFFFYRACDPWLRIEDCSLVEWLKAFFPAPPSLKLGILEH